MAITFLQQKHKAWRSRAPIDLCCSGEPLMLSSEAGLSVGLVRNAWRYNEMATAETVAKKLHGFRVYHPDDRTRCLSCGGR